MSIEERPKLRKYILHLNVRQQKNLKVVIRFSFVFKLYRYNNSPYLVHCFYYSHFLINFLKTAIISAQFTNVALYSPNNILPFFQFSEKLLQFHHCLSYPCDFTNLRHVSIVLIFSEIHVMLFIPFLRLLSKNVLSAVQSGFRSGFI